MAPAGIDRRSFLKSAALASAGMNSFFQGALGVAAIPEKLEGLIPVTLFPEWQAFGARLQWVSQIFGNMHMARSMETRGTYESEASFVTRTVVRACSALNGKESGLPKSQEIQGSMTWLSENFNVESLSKKKELRQYFQIPENWWSDTRVDRQELELSVGLHYGQILWALTRVAQLRVDLPMVLERYGASCRGTFGFELCEKLCRGSIEKELSDPRFISIGRYSALVDQYYGALLFGGEKGVARAVLDLNEAFLEIEGQGIELPAELHPQPSKSFRSREAKFLESLRFNVWHAEGAIAAVSPAARAALDASERADAKHY